MSETPPRRLRSGRYLAMAAVADAHAQPDPTQRDRLLASFGGQGRFGIFADRIARIFDWPLERAVTELGRLEQAPAWAASALPGAETIPLLAGPRYERATALFARFQPGLGFPEHVHPAGEITFVLEGAFRDGSGVVVARGDELALGDGSRHAFEVMHEGPCIAAVIAHGGFEIVRR
jgi:hypothetical protein